MCENCITFDRLTDRAYKSDVESHSYGVSNGRAFVCIRLKTGEVLTQWEAELCSPPETPPTPKQEQKPFIAQHRRSGKHLRFAVPVR